MNELLPAELQQFVQEELASGRYPIERELVVDAVRLLREARGDLAALLRSRNR